MLIVTRRPCERIMIGENVSVTILEVNGSQVRIGIDAPREIEIYREEIYERVMIERDLAKRRPALPGQDEDQF